MTFVFYYTFKFATIKISVFNCVFVSLTFIINFQ